jgi:hypothetical protein
MGEGKTIWRRSTHKNLFQIEFFYEDIRLDADNPQHVEWAFRKAQQRANQFEILGVDLRLTQGVLKRIIPAVASTNAVIAGCCALEALKLASKWVLHKYFNRKGSITN